MNSREIAVEYRLSHWAGIIKERSESGLSIRMYCKGQGICENVYYYWLKKVREAAGEGFCKNGENGKALMRPFFAEFKLPERVIQPPCEDISQNRVCVEAVGVRISADGGYPAEKLCQLLRAVMQPC